MSVEKQLCRIMGYPHCILFPRARDAISAWCMITGNKLFIPSNCCPVLQEFAGAIVPIDPETGLAPKVPVQLYGYRQLFPDNASAIEIDPLMTGAMGKPFAESTVISFGYSKTIDIGAGGAILTRNRGLAGELKAFAYFPDILRQPLSDRLYVFHAIVMQKKRDYEEIENQVARHVERLKHRPVISWRFVAKNPSKYLEESARYYGYKISHNYPPLPGVTDPGAIEWGKSVVNIWK